MARQAKTQAETPAAKTSEKTRKTSKVEIPTINTQVMRVRLIGDSPLITHKWSKKAKDQILAKQQKKPTGNKEAKDPEADFLEATYFLDKHGNLLEKPPAGRQAKIYGFPAVAVKACAVTAASSLDVTKTLMRQAFHVLGEYIVIEGQKPRMREDTVKIGQGTADLRYRPEFGAGWFADVDIQYNAGVISPGQLINLLNVGGFGVGLGEWRPERDGTFGRFHVATEAEM